MLAVLSGFAAEVFPEEDGQKLSQLRVNDMAELPWVWQPKGSPGCHSNPSRSLQNAGVSKSLGMFLSSSCTGRAEDAPVLLQDWRAQ